MRKGQFVLGYKGIYFIIALFLLTFMFLYLHTAFQEYQSVKTTCTDTAYQEIMLGKLLYSSCFTWYDAELERSIPGTIDKNKFTQQNLDSCFTFIARRVKLSVEGTTLESGGKIYDPTIINKTIMLYENGNSKPSTLQITFEEPAC